jgi:hypothetical protein
MTQHTIPMPNLAFTYERHPGGFCEPERVGAYTAEQMVAYAEDALKSQAAQLSAIESALEALVNLCNNDLTLSSDDAVIAAEAALERLYRGRAVAPKGAP